MVTLLRFLWPGDQGRPTLVLGGLGLLVATLLVVLAAWPLWAATLLVLGALAWPLGRMWLGRWREAGAPLTALLILLYLQGFHTIEHIAQWAEYHLLGWPAKLASGLISPLNAEIVHYAWNMGVLGVLVVLLFYGFGRGNVWAWLLLAWAGLHTLEHIYLMRQFLDAVAILRFQGADLRLAQGLPGVLGSHGWLSQQELPGAALFICQTVPGLTTATRLDVHFSWNIGEQVLLMLAAAAALQRGWGRSAGTAVVAMGAPVPAS